MPFRCPECSGSKTLHITARLELPPDSRSDEITLQVVKCTDCRFAGIAVYEESRRGALDSESIQHTGYRVGADDLKTLQRAIRRCPKPESWGCDCAAHRRFGTHDASGRWNGLDQLALGEAFEMEL